MAELTNDPRFAYDAYRRLVQMFGSVVMGIPDEPFEDYLTETKRNKGVSSDVELNADDWKQCHGRIQAHLSRTCRLGLPAGTAQAA